MSETPQTRKTSKRTANKKKRRCRSPSEIIRDRKIIAKMYLEHRSRREIAAVTKM